MTNINRVTLFSETQFTYDNII